QEHVLLFRIRPRRPALSLIVGKGPKAASGATHSPFDLAISKHLKGAKLLAIETPPRERIAILWFSVEGKSSETERLGLVLTFIPAAPEALLVRAKNLSANSKMHTPPQWEILTRTRTIRSAEGAPTLY